MTPADIPGDLRPRRATGVEVHRRIDDDRIILRRAGRYVALSPRSLEIWNALDGRTLHELSARFRGPDEDPGPAIAALVGTLADCGLVTLPGSAQSGLPERGDPLAVRAASGLLESYATFSPCEPIEAVYVVARHAFHPGVLAAAATIAVSGLAMFLAFAHPAPFVLTLPGAISLGFALCLATLAHEAAHALTLRHFGGTVSRAGIGWYWFAPTAFVDTSDAHLLPRERRVAVCLAGPAVDLVTAGAAALLAAADPGIAALSLQIASLMYLGFLWNLDPLLETDWYYALTDVLGRPNLRRDAFAQLFRRDARVDRVALGYGVAALVYAALYAGVVVPALVRTTFAVWLAPIAPHAIIALLPAGAASVAALAIGASMLRVTASRSAGTFDRARSCS